jgi:hypothetical protein
VALRKAYQVLNSEVTQSVYNSFGPQILRWEFTTQREFLVQGLLWLILPQYLISFIALQLWGLFGRSGHVRFVLPPSTELIQWRHLLFLGMLLYEVHVCMNPGSGVWISVPPFVIMKLLRKISVSATMALDQLAQWYTPEINLEQVLSHAENASLTSLSESSHSVFDQLCSVVDPSDYHNGMKQVKHDMVQVLISERAKRAKLE